MSENRAFLKAWSRNVMLSNYKQNGEIIRPKCLNANPSTLTCTFRKSNSRNDGRTI